MAQLEGGSHRAPALLGLANSDASSEGALKRYERLNRPASARSYDAKGKLHPYGRGQNSKFHGL